MPSRGRTRPGGRPAFTPPYTQPAVPPSAASCCCRRFAYLVLVELLPLRLQAVAGAAAQHPRGHVLDGVHGAAGKPRPSLSAVRPPSSSKSSPGSSGGLGYDRSDSQPLARSLTHSWRAPPAAAPGYSSCNGSSFLFCCSYCYCSRADESCRSPLRAAIHNPAAAPRPPGRAANRCLTAVPAPRRAHSQLSKLWNSPFPAAFHKQLLLPRRRKLGAAADNRSPWMHFVAFTCHVQLMVQPRQTKG